MLLVQSSGKIRKLQKKQPNGSDVLSNSINRMYRFSVKNRYTLKLFTEERIDETLDTLPSIADVLRYLKLFPKQSHFFVHGWIIE